MFAIVNKEIEIFDALIRTVSDTTIKMDEILMLIDKKKIELEQRIKGFQNEFAEIKKQINIPNINADDYITYTNNMLENKNEIVRLEGIKTQRSTLRAKINELIRERDDILLEELQLYKVEIEKINQSQAELKVEIEFKGNK